VTSASSVLPLCYISRPSMWGRKKSLLRKDFQESKIKTIVLLGYSVDSYVTFRKNVVQIADCFIFVYSYIIFTEDGGNVYTWKFYYSQQTTRLHIPEDITLHNHRCENLKSYNWSKILTTKITFPSFSSPYVHLRSFSSSPTPFFTFSYLHQSS
jgi:hypothetical protein